MVRNYVRETNRQDWSVENLKQAVDAVLRKEMGLKKASVQLNVLKAFLQRYVKMRANDENVTNNKIYNCDETGISENPKGNSRIIATAEICMSATRAYMPPMLIFPRKQMQKEFEVGLPPGARAEVSETE
ncbi:hypothetical protein ILUMI_24449 [Ignelater luminosus]|uniref:Uncharacterized protein n=1 Tax=Ignelater luminosus TaxID=2038154 RepID=A0A8K0CCL3_IGNLU|nr:hypothetical protein ILUMI_24449 [Ignelater luminosus]